MASPCRTPPSFGPIGMSLVAREEQQVGRARIEPPVQSAEPSVPLPSEWQYMLEQVVPAKLPDELAVSNFTLMDEFTWNEVSVTDVPLVVVSLWHLSQPKP